MTSPSDTLAAARVGDPSAFDALVAPHRRELLAHCYRMLGSFQDAEDALQDGLLSAWRGIAGFAGRSSIRTRLYRVCTNACLRLAERWPRRLMTDDRFPPLTDPATIGQPVAEPIFLEPWPDVEAQDDGPAVVAERRESVELAFVAAVQRLPPRQRAALLLRDALDFSAAETADALGTTVAAANSALQRARAGMVGHLPRTPQRAELEALGGDGERRLVAALVDAWEHADVPALLALLTEDARFTMPPLPAWFEGRVAIGRFVAERMFATPWRLVPIRANGQVALACYLDDRGDGTHRLGAVNVVSIRGALVSGLDGFLDPAVHRRFEIPPTWTAP